MIRRCTVEHGSVAITPLLMRWVINPAGGQLAQKHIGFTGPNTAAGWVFIPDSLWSDKGMPGSSNGCAIIHADIRMLSARLLYTTQVNTMDVQRIISSISRVVDSTGTAIGNPGTTADTVLTLSGIGTANSVVFIFDNGVLLTPASVTINGTWMFTETAALGRHEFIVRDDLEGVDSLEWVVIVAVVAVKPEITGFEDSTGSIPLGGSTYDSSISVMGSAEASKTVELFLDGGSKGDVLVDLSSRWKLTVHDLRVGSHSFRARANNGDNPLSDPQSIIVEALVPPTITSVRDSQGEIAPDGWTLDASVILTGTAAAGQNVQILDGAALLGTSSAIGGIWTYTLSSAAFLTYNIIARGLYGSNPESAVRRFTILDPKTENFETVPSGTINAGEVIETPTMVIRYISGRSGLSVFEMDYPGFSGKGMGVSNLLSSPEEVIILELRRVVSSVNFTYYKYDGAEPTVTVSVLNSSNIELQRKIITATSGGLDFNGLLGIKNIRITAKGAVYFDSFRYGW